MNREGESQKTYENIVGIPYYTTIRANIFLLVRINDVSRMPRKPADSKGCIYYYGFPQLTSPLWTVPLFSLVVSGALGRGSNEYVSRVVLYCAAIQHPWWGRSSVHLVRYIQ